MGVEYYKGKAIPLFESVNSEIARDMDCLQVKIGKVICYMNSKITVLYRA